MDHLEVDLFGPMDVSEDGNTFVLLLVDLATRFIWLRPLQNKSATVTATALYPIFCQFGFLKVIQGDNGTEFVNEIIKQWLSQAGVNHRLITPYHPEANGAA